jgi:hypothetical protein
MVLDELFARVRLAEQFGDPATGMTAEAASA